MKQKKEEKTMSDQRERERERERERIVFGLFIPVGRFGISNKPKKNQVSFFPHLLFTFS